MLEPGLSFHNFYKGITSNIVRGKSRIVTLPSNGGSRVGDVIACSNRLRCTFPPRTIALALRSRVSISHKSVLIRTSGIPIVSHGFRTVLM